MSKIRHSDLPFGSEFSPSQIVLKDVLEIVKKNEGVWKDFEYDIWQKYYKNNKTSVYNQKKLANNCKLGLIAYKIIDREANFTEFGDNLYKVRTKEENLYKMFGKHILINLHGITLVQCILDLQTSGEKVTLIKLREWLEDRGIHFPSGGKHPSIMRLWLEKAGVFTSGWQVDEEIFSNLLGISTEEIEGLSSLTPEQKTYLKTLANIASSGPFQSNEIKKLASATYGVKFDEKNLPKKVLYPLEEQGFIKLERGTQKPGRGAKPFFVTTTTKFKSEIFKPIIEQLEKQVQNDLRPLLRKNLEDIIDELRTKNKYKKGLALEALGFKIIKLLDMTYIATRLRGKATGGAEVDILFHTDRLVYSRWQVQCKNTKTVSLDDIAKEVGLTHFLKSNVVVVITTGKVGPEAKKYSYKIMTDSNLSIVLVDGKDIQKIIESPAAIVDIFNREAKRAMKLKKIEL